MTYIKLKFKACFFSWVIPVFNIIRRKKRGINNSIIALLSMGACIIAVWFQISYTNYLVKINDWSALMDTTNALTWVAAILIFVTIILNIISLTLNKTV